MSGRHAWLRGPVLHGLAAMLLIGVWLSASVGHTEPTAGDRHRARQLMDSGDKKVATRDLPGALQDYRAAHAIMRVPTTGIEVAKTLVALGMLVEAKDVATEVASMPAIPGELPVFPQARQDARSLALDLERRIPSIEVHVQGIAPSIHVHVTIDGETAVGTSLTRRVNPGPHSVRARAENYASGSQQLVVREGEHQKVVLSLTATKVGSAGSTDSPSSTVATGGYPVLMYVGFGVAAVGITAGSVTGLLSLSKASNVKDRCENNHCPPDSKSDADASIRLANASNICFGLGLVGVGLGFHQLIVSNRQQRKPAEGLVVRPALGLGSVGLTGAF